MAKTQSAIAAYKAGQRSVTGGKTKHRKKKMTISVAVLAGLAPTAMFALKGYKGADGVSGIEGAAYHLTGRMTGYNWQTGKFYFGELLKGWAPLIAGAVAHKFANKYGINHVLANAGIPILRI
jgi:hypothetical protein